MKAFIVAMILLVAVSGAAWFTLNLVPQSSKETFTRPGSVRL